MVGVLLHARGVRRTGGGRGVLLDELDKRGRAPSAVAREDGFDDVAATLEAASAAAAEREKAAEADKERALRQAFDGYAAVALLRPSGRRGPGSVPRLRARRRVVFTRSDVDARDYELALQNNLFINDPSAKQLYSTPQMYCTGVAEPRPGAACTRNRRLRFNPIELTVRVLLTA
jgi:hypothetical protein